MRIGIITINTRTNYGGILQVYAMTQVLSQMGHDVFVIYLPVEWKLKWYKAPFALLQRTIKKIFNRKIRVFREMYLNKTFPLVSKNTQSFIDKYIPYIEIKKYSQLQEKDWDAFVVGSDQIWRPQYNPGNVKNTFLKFAEQWNIKRIAYAASFGTDIWELSSFQTVECSKLAKLFDYISVREISGVALCRKYLEVRADFVLDPTLLVDKEKYEKIAKETSAIIPQKMLLCYILDDNDEKQGIVKCIARERKLTPFYVNSHYEDVNAPTEKRIQPSVEQWLAGFMNTELVITDSFHACVFSIIFNKQFVVIGNKKRGMGRFDSLLSLFGLTDRMIYSYKDHIPTSEIKWESVMQVLQRRKSVSLDKLNKALS